MEKEEEEKIIEEIKIDPEKFSIIFNEYYQKILNYILRRVGSISISEDIASDVFLKTFKSLNKFKWLDIPFSAFLYRVANNEIVSYYRFNNRHKVISLDKVLEDKNIEPASDEDIHKELESLEQDIARHKEFIEIQKSISSLPLKYQEVISLRFFENKKIYEIAEILNKKEGTVKSLIYRGLEKLRVKI